MENSKSLAETRAMNVSVPLSLTNPNPPTPTQVPSQTFPDHPHLDIRQLAPASFQSPFPFRHPTFSSPAYPNIIYSNPNSIPNPSFSNPTVSTNFLLSGKSAGTLPQILQSPQLNSPPPSHLQTLEAVPSGGTQEVSLPPKKRNRTSSTPNLENVDNGFTGQLLHPNNSAFVFFPGVHNLPGKPVAALGTQAEMNAEGTLKQSISTQENLLQAGRQGLEIFSENSPRIWAKEVEYRTGSEGNSENYPQFSQNSGQARLVSKNDESENQHSSNEDSEQSGEREQTQEEAAKTKRKMDDVINKACKCYTKLQPFVEVFKSMKHAGPSQARRSSHTPKNSEKAFRNITQQNKWLLENVFDNDGNYLYCFQCITTIFGLSNGRLSSLRKKKQAGDSDKLVLKKRYWSKKKLSEVITPPDVENVEEWWNSLSADDEVTVKAPPKNHGLAGRRSNSAKGEDVLEAFLKFVDDHSRKAPPKIGENKVIFYFSEEFSRIHAPTSRQPATVPGSRSLVAEFNRQQKEKGADIISNGTASNWLKKHRPNYMICPNGKSLIQPSEVPGPGNNLKSQPVEEEFGSRSQQASPESDSEPQDVLPSSPNSQAELNSSDHHPNLAYSDFSQLAENGETARGSWSHPGQYASFAYRDDSSHLFQPFPGNETGNETDWSNPELTLAPFSPNHHPTDQPQN